MRRICLVHKEARRARQRRVCDRHASTSSGVYVGDAARHAKTILRSLLLHGAQRDPAYHLLHMCGLIDHLLPMPQKIAGGRGGDAGEEEVLAMWVTQVVPNVFGAVTSLLKILDSENRRIWSGGLRNSGSFGIDVVDADFGGFRG